MNDFPFKEQKQYGRGERVLATLSGVAVVIFVVVVLTQLVCRGGGQ